MLNSHDPKKDARTTTIYGGKAPLLWVLGGSRYVYSSPTFFVHELVTGAMQSLHCSSLTMFPPGTGESQGFGDVSPTHLKQTHVDAYDESSASCV